MDACDIDSENEGQLLIDESVDGSKRPLRARTRGPRSKKAAAKKKPPLKLVVKTPKPTPSKKGKKTVVEVKNDNNSSVEKNNNVRTSSRVRKRTRKMSPSPVQTKKEPAKKKLKVRLKTIPKSLKKTKVAAQKALKLADPEPKKKDAENVDIETVSDDDLSSMHYSSVIVDEDTPDKVKKEPEPRKKVGIKLKLSLGKVLSSKVADSLEDQAQKDADSTKVDDTLHVSTPDNEKHVKPLIISKRHVCDEIATSDARYDVSSASSVDSLELSELCSETASPSYYKRCSEEHKPLTLRLSMGKPAPLKRANSEFHKSQTTAFPNIRRSWSITPAKALPGSTSEDMLDFAKAKPAIPKVIDKAQDPHQNLSTVPFFSAGLQSLLDVVSVEINEQNKDNPNAPHTPVSIKLPQLTPKSLPPSTNHLTNKVTPNDPKLIPSEKEAPGHEGHLPSLTFPKPELHFSTKKRPRSKSTINIPSPPQPHPLSLLSSVFEVKGQEEEPQELTEKEKRRRDKKKVLNSDFVDPDSIIAGTDEKKSSPKKKTVPPFVPKTKGGGFSLLMPQMAVQSNGTEQKILQLGSTCNFPSKTSSVSKRPKKGLATAKQRLANKLKIRKTFAY